MWCIKQVGYEYYINDTDNWHLDKDILGDENDRMYSANNCVLVPNELNDLSIPYRDWETDRKSVV